VKFCLLFDFNYLNIRHSILASHRTDKKMKYSINWSAKFYMHFWKIA